MRKQEPVVKEQFKAEKGQVAAVEPKVETPASVVAKATKAAVVNVSAKPKALNKPAVAKAQSVAAPGAGVPAEKTKKVEKMSPAKDVSAKSVATPAAKAKAEKKGHAKKQAPKKAKLVRDSFTFPESDYARIDILKQRVIKAGQEIKKSELLRAGLVTLCNLTDDQLLEVLDGIDKLKPGRPSK